MPSAIQRGRLASQIWRAVKELNPKIVAAEAGREVRVGVLGDTDQVQELTAALVGSDPLAYDAVADTLVLVTLPLDDDAQQVLSACDLVLYPTGYSEPLPRLPRTRMFEYTPGEDAATLVKQVLDVKELGYTHLPLGRKLAAFRPQVSTRIIQTTSIENAVFVTSTSLGNIIPNPLQPLASVAEAIGDTAVLTANQVRMLFRLVAIHGSDPAWRDQLPEITSIVGAAFGWRSIARELVSKIPMGGGVVPKAAIAFAGTWAVGDGIDFYHRTGRRLTKEEIRQHFDAAYEKGRTAAEEIFGKLKQSYEQHVPGPRR